MRLWMAGLLLTVAAHGATFVPEAVATASGSTEAWDCFEEDGQEICLKVDGNGYAGASAGYGSLHAWSEAEDYGNASAEAYFYDQLTIFGGSGTGQIDWDFIYQWDGYLGTRGQYSLPSTFEFGVPFEISGRVESCAAYLAHGGRCSGGGGASFEIIGITITQFGSRVSFTWEAASGTAYPFVSGGGGPTGIANPEPSTWVLMAAPLALLLWYRGAFSL